MSFEIQFMHIINDTLKTNYGHLRHDRGINFSMAMTKRLKDSVSYYEVGPISSWILQVFEIEKHPNKLENRWANCLKLKGEIEKWNGIINVTS